MDNMMLNEFVCVCICVTKQHVVKLQMINNETSLFRCGDFFHILLREYKYIKRKRQSKL